MLVVILFSFLLFASFSLSYSRAYNYCWGHLFIVHEIMAPYLHVAMAASFFLTCRLQSTSLTSSVIRLQLGYCRVSHHSFPLWL
ncbi:hypothetical protein BX070DRAFT_227354 [Coemansia spiralis]|nr:hypothetical protein BX070DRAFT_227354 [Coemansia spiralis]